MILGDDLKVGIVAERYGLLRRQIVGHGLEQALGLCLAGLRARVRAQQKHDGQRRGRYRCSEPNRIHSFFHHWRTPRKFVSRVGTGLSQSQRHAETTFATMYVGRSLTWINNVRDGSI